MNHIVDQSESDSIPFYFQSYDTSDNNDNGDNNYHNNKIYVNSQNNG